MIAQTGQMPALLARAGSRICALPLESVVETMRPLPTAPVADMPAFLRGLAIIRGAPAPVVDLGALFGLTGDGARGRFVLLRLEERRVALAVEEVIAVRHLDRSEFQVFPPLLRGADADLVTAIAVRDQQLLFVLQATRLVPDDVWQRLPASEVTS